MAALKDGGKAGSLSPVVMHARVMSEHPPPTASCVLDLGEDWTPALMCASWTPSRASLVTSNGTFTSP